MPRVEPHDRKERVAVGDPPDGLFVHPRQTQQRLPRTAAAMDLHPRVAEDARRGGAELQQPEHLLLGRVRHSPLVKEAELRARLVPLNREEDFVVALKELSRRKSGQVLDVVPDGGDLEAGGPPGGGDDESHKIEGEKGVRSRDTDQRGRSE